MKVIFLAFANSSTDPLPNLQEEFDYLNALLSKRELEGQFKLYVEPYATIEKINQALETFNNDLVIFSYSGHADQTQLLLDNQQFQAEGISRQLTNAAGKGVLKLVILNGCSTYGQVKMLKTAGVPAVIATSAPVNDKSAKEFSKRFWNGLVTYNKTIEDAYEDALGPAFGAKLPGNTAQEFRHIQTQVIEDKTAVWMLERINEPAIKYNPIPYALDTSSTPYTPNEALYQTLKAEFFKAENPELVYLYEQEQRGKIIKRSDYEIAIVNSIPHPIAKHLQKLLCPTDGTADGYDKVGKMRLFQIGQLFQTASEFMGFIMIAQVWELTMKFDDLIIDEDTKKVIQEYFSLDTKSRETYKYLKLIAATRNLIEREAKQRPGITLFIKEQEILSDMYVPGNEFADACEYLWNLRCNTIKDQLDADRLTVTCQEAEKYLCAFVKQISFVHRYHLTSIQNIDILKYRHTTREKTSYRHKIISLMQAIGKDEYNYYFLPDFLDNWGVVLIRGQVRPRNVQKGEYEAEALDYLNLSPFIIDRNAFESNSDLSNLMFFRGFGADGKTLQYKRISHPMNPRDMLDVGMKEEFETVRLEFGAFRQLLLNE
ncbi:CHAT domain-containing protein [Flavihumibacter fluvii]|uniref:CHAT domain-containing protein n=1 Tax=Flavihumibacter fluvii TaxID=2838157 RepID=UPI001BDE5C91|nr:CHAT domain-containing protein [Flavihumibacter fluvii]ULQ51776.1 CHAT domain-containing protein [Flavihumibacter fluvii]